MTVAMPVPGIFSDDVDSPSMCVVLVPAFSHIEPKCEIALRELESRGYVVRRQFGFSQIDFGRNVMASVALRDGFEQLMWIDADISFQPDFVDQLRRHQLPIVTGIYTKKRSASVGLRSLARDRANPVWSQWRLSENSVCAGRFLAHASSRLRSHSKPARPAAVQPASASSASLSSVLSTDVRARWERALLPR